MSGPSTVTVTMTVASGVDDGAEALTVQFGLTDDQQFFRETTTKFLEDTARSPRFAARRGRPGGFDRDWWRRGAELGWTSMLVPEADGGGCVSGHGLLDLVAGGRGDGSAGLAGTAAPDQRGRRRPVRGRAPPAQRASILPGIVGGESSPPGAWPSRAVLGGPGRRCSSAAVARGDGFVLDGTKAGRGRRPRPTSCW